MRYYIEKIETWPGPANEKTAELYREMVQYEHCLVDGEIAKDALVEQIRRTVDRVNKAYPDTEELVVYEMEGRVTCQVSMKHNPLQLGYEFYFQLEPVRRIYSYVERAEEGKKYIEAQPRTAAGTGADSDGKGGEE